MAPDEMGDLKAIERAIGNPLPRVKLEDFDYAQRPAERLEIPLAQRIAAIRAQKADERAAPGQGRPAGSGPRGGSRAWSGPGAPACPEQCGLPRPGYWAGLRTEAVGSEVSPHLWSDSAQEHPSQVVDNQGWTVSI